MKRNKYLIALLALFIMAALFIAACSGPEPAPTPGPGPDPSGNYDYTITITGQGGAQPPFTVKQGEKLSLTRTITAKDGSSTAGISFTYTDSVTGGGVTVNSAGSELTAAAGAKDGDHVFTVSGKKSGTEVAKTTFTVNVQLATWGISFDDIEPITHGETGAAITYKLTAPNGDVTGVTFDISTTSGSTLTLTKNATRPRIDIATVPDSTVIGEHRFTVAVKKGGETKTSGNLAFGVVPRYTLAAGQQMYTVSRNGNLNLTYTLTKSDGTAPTGVIVGCFCSTDYENCDLLKAYNNWVTSDKFSEITVPSDAEVGKNHGMSMRAETETFDFITDCSFNIKVE